MIRLAIGFTNLGPYHLARLRAAGSRLRSLGGELIVHELASTERKYPWSPQGGEWPFARRTLFADRTVEDIPAAECAAAMTIALDDDEPDAVAVVGYVRPESMAALRWAERRGRPAILLSETGERDVPRVWWKEAVKSRRVRRFSSALVGGPSHRDYLARLGMPRSRIALGYDAVDHEGHARRSDELRIGSPRPAGTEGRPYFLAVNRFAPEKNLEGLIRAFALYRGDAGEAGAWDLALCGGGPSERDVDGLVRHLGLRSSVHRPGFLAEDALAPWYAHASVFVHPARSEPWGLVVNEAAASALPLLVSDRAGCAETLVPDPSGTTGRRIDPDDVDAMASALAWMAGLDASERMVMGASARRVSSAWGPERFADGLMEALDRASAAPRRFVRGRMTEASR